jgi:hypothetical protein
VSTPGCGCCRRAAPQQLGSPCRRHQSPRLSCISKIYDYGVGVLAFSPVANVRRPKVSDDSSTVGPDVDELVRLLDGGVQGVTTTPPGDAGR